MEVIKDRKGEEVDRCIKQENGISFLYQTLIGRLLLKLLTKRFVSNLAGVFMNSRLSIFLIDNVVNDGRIDLDIYQKTKFASYNDFFTRKMKKGIRTIDYDQSSFISPCDSKLTAYKIDNDSVFYIKNGVYTIKDFFGNENQAAQNFLGGYCLIFRLTVDDYHRYCYIDDGDKGGNTFIKGKLHSVNPMVLNNYNFYKTNCREYTILNTKNFGKVAQIEVGAMMVGRITNLHSVHQFKRGEEKGYFEFGGSTIVLLVQKDKLIIDSDILTNTAEGAETLVKLGEKIGVKK